MTEGTNQGLFIVIAIIIFGIFIGLSHSIFGNQLESGMYGLFINAADNTHYRLTGEKIIRLDPETVVVFEDGNLENTIINELKNKYGIALQVNADTNKEEVTIGDMFNLQEVDISNKNIDNLEGMQYALNLEVLDASDNNIIDVTPISYLSNLKTLTISGNYIDDITYFSNLTSLETLDISYNELETADSLTKLTELTSVNLEGNNITDYSGLIGIPDIANKVVVISDTTLRNTIKSELGIPNDVDITIKDMVDLTRVEFITTSQYFSVRSLDGLQYASNLKELTIVNGSFYANQFQGLAPISNLRNLESLRIGAAYGQPSNRISLSDLSPLSNIDSLKEINITRSRFTDVDALKDISNLETLMLANNRITDVSAFSNSSSLQSIKHLNLKNNPITDLTPLVNLNNIESIDLENTGDNVFRPLAETDFYSKINIDLDNRLESYVKSKLGIDSSTQLRMGDILTLDDITYNSTSQYFGIGSLDGLEYADNLERLTIVNGRQSTRFTDISNLSGLKKLTYIRLPNHSIRDASPLSELDSIEYLNLSGNRNLRSLDTIRDLPNLTYLHLSNTGLTDIGDFNSSESLQKLKHLDLRNNTISDLTPLRGLSAIETILLESTGVDSYRVLSETDFYSKIPLTVDNRLSTSIRDTLGLTSDTIINIGHMLDLTELSYLSTSQYFGVGSLDGLEYADNLEKLEIVSGRNGAKLSDIAHLSNLNNLKHIHLPSHSIRDINPLSTLESVEYLNLAGNRGISDLTPLINYQNLEYLNLSNISTSADFSVIKHLDVDDFIQ